MDKTYFKTKEAADYIGVSHKSLEKWRVTGGGPIFSSLGTRVVYSRTDLDAWVAALRRRSTSDAGRAA